MEETSESEVVRLEKLLPRMPVRVLLVENDDSTRRIITALLCKCCYRVTAVSDGLKAWESLKENSHNVDLVLTEVELPLLSGLGLLTMIMDNARFNYIPVIMMSSHDSINLVFKCMLKGAMDFLVKPIRKNELRNLWQHVWRRLSSVHIQSRNELGTQLWQHDPAHKRQKLGTGDINHSRNRSSENATCLNKVFDVSKETDAQSSCTDTEADSKHLHKFLELKKTCHFGVDTSPENGEEIVEEAVPLDPESKTCMESSNPCETIMDEQAGLVMDTNVDEARVTFSQSFTSEQETHCKQVTVKLEAIDDPPIHRTSGSCTVPVELSLMPQQSNISEEHKERNTLNHSKSSAFSTYTSKRLLPATPPKVIMPSKEYLNSANTPSVENPENYLKPLESDGLSPINREGRRLSEGIGIAFNDDLVQLQAVSFPVPFRWQIDSSLKQPMFFSQFVHDLRGDGRIESCSTSSSNCSKPEKKLSTKHFHEGGSPTHIANQKEYLELIDDDGVGKRNVGSSFTSSSCSNKVEIGNCGDGLLVSNGNGSTQTEARGLNLREATLNKFRLKRKERCYEKRVRYQSKNLLAEKHPRVKGQFVARTRDFRQATAQVN